MIAYTTNAGSTADVAKAIGEELTKSEAQVDVRRLEEVSSLEGYEAAVVGGPMILGWHRAAQKFVKAHQAELSRIPVAYFFTAMRLTQTGEESIGETRIFIDPRLAKAPKQAGKLSYSERYASPGNYLRPALKAAPQVKPVMAGFFGGDLELAKLNYLQIFFVMVVVRAQLGDYRNWEAIRGWAGSLSDGLHLNS